jgi:hypothetical protein
MIKDYEEHADERYASGYNAGLKKIKGIIEEYLPTEQQIYNIWGKVSGGLYGVFLYFGLNKENPVIRYQYKTKYLNEGYWTGITKPLTDKEFKICRQIVMDTKEWPEYGQVSKYWGFGFDSGPGHALTWLKEKVDEIRQVYSKCTKALEDIRLSVNQNLKKHFDLQIEYCNSEEKKNSNNLDKNSSDDNYLEINSLLKDDSFLKKFTTEPLLLKEPNLTEEIKFLKKIFI